MNFAYSDDQKALSELARKILADKATHERIGAIEKSESGFDQEIWAELAKANLLGACLPEEFGGSGLGMLELWLLLEEIGRAVAPVPFWATLALGALPIAEFGTAQQKAACLPGVIAAEIILSGAFEEADADDPARPSTRAVRDGAAWRLSGTKICVPAAHIAARVLVPASVGGGRVGLFLVDPKGPGAKLEMQRAASPSRRSGCRARE